LKVARAAVGDTFVHGAYQMNPSSFLPLDSGTYMPTLAFYGQQVKKLSY
jgi:sialate O-acetylesterase